MMLALSGCTISTLVLDLLESRLLQVSQQSLHARWEWILSSTIIFINSRRLGGLNGVSLFKQLTVDLSFSEFVEVGLLFNKHMLR